MEKRHTYTQSRLALFFRIGSDKEYRHYIDGSGLHLSRTYMETLVRLSARILRPILSLSMAAYGPSLNFFGYCWRPLSRPQASKSDSKGVLAGRKHAELRFLLRRKRGPSSGAPKMGTEVKAKAERVPTGRKRNTKLPNRFYTLIPLAHPQFSFHFSLHGLIHALFECIGETGRAECHTGDHKIRASFAAVFMPFHSPFTHSLH